MLSEQKAKWYIELRTLDKDGHWVVGYHEQAPWRVFFLSPSQDKIVYISLKAIQDSMSEGYPAAGNPWRVKNIKANRWRATLNDRVVQCGVYSGADADYFYIFTIQSYYNLDRHSVTVFRYTVPHEEYKSVAPITVKRRKCRG